MPLWLRRPSRHMHQWCHFDCGGHHGTCTSDATLIAAAITAHAPMMPLWLRRPSRHMHQWCHFDCGGHHGTCTNDATLIAAAITAHAPMMPLWLRRPSRHMHQWCHFDCGGHHGTCTYDATLITAAITAHAPMMPLWLRRPSRHMHLWCHFDYGGHHGTCTNDATLVAAVRACMIFIMDSAYRDCLFATGVRNKENLFFTFTSCLNLYCSSDVAVACSTVTSISHPTVNRGVFHGHLHITSNSEPWRVPRWPPYHIQQWTVACSTVTSISHPTVNCMLSSAYTCM